MKETKEPAWLADQIIREAHDAIIMADREGVIRLWNRGAEMIFGFSAAEALGQSLHIIIPEKLRARHDHGYQQVMKAGRSRYSSELLAVPALTKDGHRISVEFTIILIRDDHDHILGVAAIIRDVTSRWEKERALQRRLAELETQSKPEINPEDS